MASHPRRTWKAGGRAPIAPAGGIDWTDAGIGAGSPLGLSLIGIGGELLLMHRKQIGPAFRAGAGS